MTSKRLLCLPPALILAACGGGSGGSGVTSVPSSGTYGYVLKANGPTTGLSYGLSLVHPATPGVEYLVETGSAVLTDSRVVSSGSVDTTHRTAGPLTPYAVVYIIGGDVRRVPLQANGKSPSTQVQRANSTDACNFLTDAQQNPIGDALDYATPENTRFVVTTAGADGICGTSDDGAAEVRLDASAGLVYNELSGSSPLGFFRDATTLAPAGWIFPKSVTYWTSGAGTSVVTRQSADAPFVSALSSIGAVALMDDGTQISTLDMSSGATPVEDKLDAATTGGGGWAPVGYDANDWYVYRNSSDSSGTWTMLQITRAAPFASVLAQNGGEVSVASMGTSLIYATVIGAQGNSLQAVSKSVGVPAQTLDSGTTSTLTTVQTSASGVHELWRVTNIGTSSVNYQLEFIDEGGNIDYLVNAGGYPMLAPEATTISFDQSENRTQFVYANGYGVRGFGDAQLVAFDTGTQANTVLGNLPGSAAFGTQTVYAGATGGPGSFMGGFAAAQVSGDISATGQQVFSFDVSKAGSLQLTNSQTQ